MAVVWAFAVNALKSARRIMHCKDFSHMYVFESVKMYKDTYVND